MKSLVLLLSVLALSAPAEVTVRSPNGKITTTLTQDSGGRLVYSIEFNGRQVLAPSPIGVIVDGIDYGAGDEMGKAVIRRFREHFPWRGRMSEVRERGRSARVHLRNHSGAGWELDLRCFNDAVAWRAVIPGLGVRKVSGEASAWVLPEGTVAWCNPDTANGEGIFERWAVDQIPPERFKNGIGLPVTLELPGGGFAALTEAEAMGYSGMTVEPGAGWTLKSSFRDDPQGWTMNGEVRTPWRVMMVASDLDGLVNCEAVPSLCPPPNKQLFPDGIRTGYLKPGRCLWQWWAYNDAGTLWDRQHWFVDQAALLNCQYYLVDAGWETTREHWGEGGKTAWDRLKELCDYAAGKGIGIWVWRGWTYNEKGQWPGLETQQKREDFFRYCAAAGVKGVKIDFMDSQSHDRLAFYQACLQTAAKYRIMLDFHGANKPAGESRTWPNEMTREGVRGLEYNKWSALPPSHYATLPFTRYLAGHGDFTPTTFQPQFLKGTTVAQQLACAVIMTSPLLCWADKPDVYLNSPVVDVIRTMPPVWDETHVLAGSKIGDLAILARRSGRQWYVGIINGAGARTQKLDFSFLRRGKWTADFFADTPGDPATFKIERGVRVDAHTLREVEMNAGGGLVVHLR